MSLLTSNLETITNLSSDKPGISKYLDPHVLPNKAPFRNRISTCGGDINIFTFSIFRALGTRALSNFLLVPRVEPQTYFSYAFFSESETPDLVIILVVTIEIIALGEKLDPSLVISKSSLFFTATSTSCSQEKGKSADIRSN